MESTNKKNNQAFLEKFKGRTNKIDKHGTTHALEPLDSPPSPPSLPSPHQLPRPNRKKLTSLTREVPPSPSMDLQKQLNQYEPLSDSRKKAYMNPKLSKIEHLPLLYNPQRTPITLSAKDDMPPSRSISEKSENLHRRVFGKYLKLDQQALKHLQFLHQINKNNPKHHSVHSVHV